MNETVDKRIVEVLYEMAGDVGAMTGYSEAGKIIQTIAMNLEGKPEVFHRLVGLSQGIAESKLTGRDWGMVQTVVSALLTAEGKRLLGEESEDIDVKGLAHVLDAELEFAKEHEDAMGTHTEQPVMMSLRQRAERETEAEAEAICNRIFRSPNSPRKAALQNA